MTQRKNRFARPNRTVVLVALATAGATALAAGFWQLRKPPSQEAAGAASDASAAIAAASRSSQAAIAGKRVGELPVWTQGASVRYTMQQQTEVTQDNGVPMIAISLSGTLDVARISERQVRFSFEGKLESLDGGKSTAGLGDDARAKLEAQFHEPFFAELPLGANSVLFTSRSVPPFVIQNWKSLLGELQFQAGEAVGTRWQVSEPSPLGSCEFEYDLRPDNEVGKHSSACTPKADDGLAAGYVSIDLDRVFRFGVGGRLDAFTVDEAVVTKVTQLTPSFRSRHLLSLRFVSQEGLSAAQLASYNNTLNAEAVNANELVEAARDAELDTARVGNREFAGVMAELVTLQSKLQDRASREKYEREYVALVGMLRLSPTKHLDTIEEHIKQDGPLQSALISALQDSGTEVAHARMAKLFNASKLSRDAKMELARGLSLTSQPSLTSVEALRTMKSDPVYGGQAVYGLGSSAYKLRETNPELSREISKELVHELQTTSSLDDQLARLIALGNAGPADAIDAIRPSLTSSNENIRAAAAQALRRIEDDHADELLLILLTDESPIVRVSAIGAVGERKPTQQAVARIAALCVAEPTFHARAVAVQLATSWLSAAPALTQVLDAVATRDESEDLRLIARNALAAAASAG